MNKTITKRLAAGLTVTMLLSGCSSQSGQSGGAETDGSDSDSEYGSIKTVESPAGFTGNTGEVSVESGDTYAVITIQGFGSVTCKLFPEAAPEGVQNFIDLANSGYYNGKEIHRVVANFIIQGGSANGDGILMEEDIKFDVEYNANMRHYYGALCFSGSNNINSSQFYFVNKKSYDPPSGAELKSNVEYFEEQISLCKEAAAASLNEEDKANFEYEAELYTIWNYACKSQLRAYQELTDEMIAKYWEVGGTPYLDGAYTVFGQTVEGFDVIDAISAVEVEEQPTYDNELSHPVQPIIIQSVEIFTA